ncbi:MAG: citrate lyase acyl carrier protein [Clostridia bacterium]|nr:citrate lyase acyl carrier protein [Clostridia bacterium]
MKVKEMVKSGSLESSDLLVMITPLTEGEGLKLEINSIVKKQYGDRIRDIVMEVLNESELEDSLILIQDRGALDYAIKSRVETALSRIRNKEE